ncbi:hypothetical protein T11_13550 [Trichinella zimbabwensis]|uniref:Uncharacterized protein n=1 Tax=Trichinella zimbabwensis TaxID=268475 RepID=A0A0V1H6L0_9BILA|nr:hypothetical protein T11_13550 [Trichinella zimbabwensis]
MRHKKKKFCYWNVAFYISPSDSSPVWRDTRINRSTNSGIRTSGRFHHRLQ